jgi:hypothetical protein
MNMSNVGGRKFKSAKARNKGDAAIAKKAGSRKQPRTQGKSKAPGKRRLGKPS